MTLREVLHAHIPTLRSNSTVREAVDKMDVYQFPALVVVDDDAKPLAVLTEGDLCRAVHQRDSVMKLAYQTAMTFASPDPVTAPIDTEISDALHTMLSRGITLLPVIENERMMGIVLRVDLMQAMLLDVEPAPSSSGPGA